MNIILIPCANRPEFLYYCVEKLKKCEEAKEMLTLFHVDFKHDKYIHNIVNRYPYNKEVIINERHGWNKLPVNILRGYKKAVERTDEYVFMIEEDVMVGTDFFNWHIKIHEKEKNIFCSIASRNNNLDRDLQLDHSFAKYYLSHNTYQSLGVCFKKGVLNDFVLPHANKEYFINNEQYCLSHFPDSQFKRQWTEQAGLIRRIQEKNRMPIAYPFIPRAFHAGFYGKNRTGQIKGNILKKINQLGQIIFDNGAMKANSMHERYYDDSKPIELNQPIVDKVVLDNIKKL